MIIPLQAEKIFEIAGFGVTNSIFTTFVIVILVSVIALIYSSRISYENPGKLQLFLEYVIESLRGISLATLGFQPAKFIFPLTFTFFTIVILSNWSGLLPFTGPIGLVEKKHEVGNVLNVVYASEEKELQEEEENIQELYPTNIVECLSNKCVILFTPLRIIKLSDKQELIPVFRPMTSDLNGTLSLALFSVVLTNFWGIKINKEKYLKKYINIPTKLSMNSVIFFFVGILESILELAKILSFSFRMFGNAFAGEVLLIVMYNLGKGIVSIPFFILEMFVGFIQAYVFFVLTTSYTGLAVEEQHH